jgi:hypothetical protein
MQFFIPLGAVNLLLVSVYLMPHWVREAVRILNSPFGGLHDRSHAAAVNLICEFFGLRIDGMLVVSKALASLKLLIVAAMAAFLIEFVRAIAERHEPDRATIDAVLMLAFIFALTLVLSALGTNDIDLVRTLATQVMLVCGAVIVTMVERDAEGRVPVAQSSVPVVYKEPVEQRLAA